MAPTPLLSLPYNVILSNDPYDDVLQICIKDFGTNPTMGMILQQDSTHLAPQLLNILPSQPCSKVKKWRSTLKGSFITQIEQHITTIIEEVKLAIQQC